MHTPTKLTLGLLLCLLLAIPAPLEAQSLGGGLVPDPGVRGGPADAGGPIGGLSANEQRYFSHAATVFAEVDGVANGLGPRFNADSCAACHAQPAAGGSSPSTNPQVAMATKNGAHASAGSEANAVIANFNAALIADQQSILEFLRSL